jgi:cytochrome P450
MVVLRLAPGNTSKRPVILDLLRLITNPVAALSSIHKNHGDLVTVRFFQKRLLIVSKPELMEEVYSLEAKNKISRDFLHDILQPVFYDGLINSKHETWVKQRRLMQPLFTKEAVLAWEQHIITEASIAVSKLKKNAANEINLSKELKTLVQNIFIKVLFGQIKEERDDQKLTQALNTALDALLPRVAMETLGKGKLKVLLSYQNRKYRAATNVITQYVYKEIERNTGATGQNILSYLIQAEDKRTGYQMTKELLHDEMVDLFIAGQDTTIIIMTWFFYMIAKNEEIHAKISEEIHRFKDEPIIHETISKLEYTKAALYETMRLYPPAPGLIRQTLDDVVVGGEKIAKGTAIILNVYAIHYSKNLWSDPYSFNPDRFLDEQTTQRHKYAFMPFGGGAHNCIGRHFSELEMMIIATMILRDFKIKANNNIKTKASVTLKADRDLIVTLTSIKPTKSGQRTPQQFS